MRTVALFGNPNVGKTSLFNTLTGSNQYVGNWAGVTVEKKEGFIGKDIKVVDLPGIYAMDTYSNEEKVSKAFLESGEADVIVNIVDASNLNRNLYLTTQLMAYRIPMVLVANMTDVAEAKGMKIDYGALSRKLGATVLPMVASKGTGTDELVKLLETSDFFKSSIDNDFQFQSESEAYAFIDKIVEESLVREVKEVKHSVTEKIDRILLNKYLAYPLFFLAMFLIFKMTFSWVGTPLSDLMDVGMSEKLVPFLKDQMSGMSPWFVSLIMDGIVGGVGAVIVFLPVILTLFLGISLLEDSGYMARAAFIMDKVMRKVGLSGKAFIPLIVGFGCSVPGVMSARTLESEKDRKLTALLVPLMSCNARLPVYGLFASVFFPGRETLVVFSLYMLGIAMALLVGLLFKSTLFKKDEEPFIIELPEYKAPDLKNVMRQTWDKGKGFLKKASTLIFSMSVLIWFLSNFNFGGFAEMNESFLASMGHMLVPLFAPLGFGSWQSSISLLTGLMAKEVVIGTMGVIYGGNLEAQLAAQFTQLSAYAFLVFVLLYTPCVSVIATMKKEYGRGFAAFSVAYQFILAWVVSFLVYNIGTMIF